MPKKKNKQTDLSKPLWKNRISKEAQEDYVGFVYIIKQRSTGKYYIGSKTYWNAVTKPPLKGRQNKRHSRKESNWKTYWGSSTKLNEEIERIGTQDFERQILKHCKTKFDKAYTEAEWQFKMNVLFDPQSFNEIINVRVSRSCSDNITEEVQSE